MTMDNRSRDPRGGRGTSMWIMVLAAILVVVAAVYMFGLWGGEPDMASDVGVDTPAVTGTTPTDPTTAPGATTGSTAVEPGPAIDTRPAPTTTAPTAQ